MKTCGACHDTEYIARNNYHAQAGLDEMYAFPDESGGRPWDTSPGIFGRWNPLTYRLLSSHGDEKQDMGTADWIRIIGSRHVGGGPARYSRYSGQTLDQTEPSSEIDPETHVIDPETGRPRAWDWKKSGTVEVNCLLCHVQNPNNIERVRALRDGEFKWASTATLTGSGLVTKKGDTYQWVGQAFDSEGRVLREYFRVSGPESNNCRICHGRACRCTDPVVYENSLENWAVETSGEIFSPGRMFDSGMNLKNKQNLYLPFDLHAERLLKCSSCHYSMNNPKYSQKALVEARPSHLVFDGRKQSTNNYLVRPDHNLVKGHTAQGTVARRLDGSMRTCGDCHQATVAHDFLPYKQLHFEKLDCQTCHIPKVYSPARRMTDWTIMTAESDPVIEHRGVIGPVNDPHSLIDGYQPVLLMREADNGQVILSPHNIIASWFWVGGDPERPVRLMDLKAAYLTKDGEYHPDIVSALDDNKDGRLGLDELKLDTEAKVAAVKRRLESVSVANPRIKGELQPFTLSHGVVTGEFALRDCRACHSYNSRINYEIELAGRVPNNVVPELVGDSKTLLTGKFEPPKPVDSNSNPALIPKRFTYMEPTG